MEVDNTVTQWIEQLRSDKEEPVQQLWEHYVQQLVRSARKKLPANIRRAYDEEDAQAKGPEP